MIIPFYLQHKLQSLKITNIEQINQLGYLQIFAQLRLIFPSLSYQALFDLYQLSCEVNTRNLSDELKTRLIHQYKSLPPQYPALAKEKISYYLAKAAQQAKLASASNEIPIGAVIVYDDNIIGAGYNQTQANQDILAHAEIQAIRQAQQKLDNCRLNNCDIYVTIEPCLMCSGAIIHSRIKRLIFGALETKTGACQSQYQVFANTKANHHCQVIGPIDQDYYSQLINKFFRTAPVKT